MKKSSLPFTATKKRRAKAPRGKLPAGAFKVLAGIKEREHARRAEQAATTEATSASQEARP